MPDWFYDVLESFQAFMDRGSPADGLVVLGMSVVALPLLVFAHEAGHALAVRARGLPLAELVVGDTPDLTIRTGGVRIQLGRHVGNGDVGGYVRYDGSTASPTDVLIIALAGPAANLLVTPVIVALAVAEWSQGIVEGMLWVIALVSLFIAVGNLVPSDIEAGLDAASDGRWVQIAWSAMHAPPDAAAKWVDPHAATSVPPPTA